jgi:hypothetical protein
MTAYRIHVGSYTASSRAGESNRLLVALTVELGMDQAGGACHIELSGADYAPVAPEDPVTVEIDGGHVFTGAADVCAATAASQIVSAVDGLARLARLEVEAAFADVTADYIVKDLLSRAGAIPGTIARGPQLPAYVLHRPPRALHHLRALAALCGADPYTDGQGNVHVAAPKSGGADHRFTYGETVKAIDLRATPAADGIEVWGEGAASSKGADKAHWLPTRLDGVAAKASLDAHGAVGSGGGKRPVRWQNGAIRSGQAAKEVAEARMKAAAARRVTGHIDLTGMPGIFPGDLVTIEKLPAGHAAAALLEPGPLRVRGLRHVLDRMHGLSTRLTF